MTINEIEEKDRRLVKKIRGIIEQKENQTVHKKAFWKSTGFWLPLLCIGLIGLGLTTFRQPTTTAVQDAPDTPPPTVATAEPTITAEKRTDEAAVPPATPVVPADDEADTTVAPVAAPAAPQSGDLPVETDGETEVEADASSGPLPAASEVPDAPIANDPDPAIASGVASAPTTETPDLSDDVRINGLVTCGGVRDKQYVSQKSTFSLASDPFVMVWMRVLSDNPPFTLTHVYSVNGKHYCDVPLEILYPHMRTWSRVTINRDIHIGAWHVDVVDDKGQTLDQIEFTVVP